MQHPFEGIMRPGHQAIEASPTRRSALRQMLGAVTALFATAASAPAYAFRRRPTTLALGEEGGAVTTQALGEEGGVVTTYAWGEEGGWWPPPRHRWPTTYATGEEGGWMAPSPGPVAPIPRVPPIPPIRYPTTLALGEEGGAGTTP